MSVDKKPRELLEVSEITELRKRRVSKETCAYYGYGVGKDRHGRTVQIAPYFDRDGNEVAQKIRYPPTVREDGKKQKPFVVTGKMPGTLFGQQLFREGGKRLVITEGEIDALSVFEVMSGKFNWPVVSVPNGAQGAVKAVQDNIEFIESYEEVILCFDMDAPGREAVNKVADLLTPGKAKIVTLPCKDPSDCLMEGKRQDLIRAIWEAKVRRPDGVINANSLRDAVHQSITHGFPYPWKHLDKITYGQHDGRIVTWLAGSGVGKSQFVREIAYNLAVEHNQKVGYVALEENVGFTALKFVSLHLNKPVHLPGQISDRSEVDHAFDEVLAPGNIWLYDHFGSMEEDALFSKLRYMAAMGCKVIVLDHLTIVLSGLEQDSGERQAIDKTMTRLRQFTEQTGVCLHLVSHLSRPKDGKGHEDGGKPSASQARGSHGIIQLSDFVFGLQRNSSSPDPKQRNLTYVWVIKNRLSGETGLGCVCRYVKSSGRIIEVDWFVDDEGEIVVDPWEDDEEEELQEDEDDDVPF